MIITSGDTPTLVFLMVDSDNYTTAVTGITPTVQISKAGGAFAAATNSPAEIANGWYKVALTATETDTAGAIILRATGTGAAEWREVHEVYAATLATAQFNKIADHVLRRSLASAIASSDGDTLSFRSLIGAAAKMVNRVARSGSTLTIYRTDDSTSLGTQTLTTGSGDPITEINTD